MTKDIDVLGVAQDDSPSSMHALALHGHDWSKNTCQNCGDETENEFHFS